MTFIFMVHFSFLCNSIANLWRHVWYHYNTVGYPVIIVSKVIDISCNGRRNVLLNFYIFDIFVDTINGFVCIRIVGGYSFLWHGTQIFNCILCIQSNLVLNCLCVAVYVKIAFQHINYPYILIICRPNFMKFKNLKLIFSTWCKHMALIHQNVKITIIMVQWKTYLNTCLIWITMLVRLLEDVDILKFR